MSFLDSEYNGFDDYKCMSKFSRCPTEPQHNELSLIQTHVPQCQPGEHTKKNNEDWYEAFEDHLSLRELDLFSVAESETTNVKVVARKMQPRIE